MSQNTSSAPAIQTLSDDSLDQVQGGWGCGYRRNNCGYKRENYCSSYEDKYESKKDHGYKAKEDKYEPKKDHGFKGWGGYGCK